MSNKKTLTLKPSYATPNTICFKEEGAEVVTAPSTDWLSKTPTAATGEVFLGSFYLNREQIAALGYKPTAVGDEYTTAPDRRGKTYTRADIEGPSLKLTIEVA